jgi:hypothetical protein
LKLKDIAEDHAVEKNPEKNARVASSISAARWHARGRRYEAASNGIATTAMRTRRRTRSHRKETGSHVRRLRSQKSLACETPECLIRCGNVVRARRRKSCRKYFGLGPRSILTRFLEAFVTGKSRQKTLLSGGLGNHTAFSRSWFMEHSNDRSLGEDRSDEVWKRCQKQSF